MGTKETIEIEILRITEEGKGIGYHENKMVIIDGVREDDKNIKCEIKTILEESILATKTSSAAKTKSTRKDLVDSPYALDDDDDEEEEEFDDDE